MAELWDLTDERGNRTGEVVRRGSAGCPPGRFHLVVATCVVGGDGLVLMTCRAATKDFPLKWEFPGGSALSGESSRRAAVRELREETGIVAAEAELQFAGRLTEHTALLDMYVVAVSGRPAVVMDPVEVSDAAWVTTAEVEERHATGQMAQPWGRRLAVLWPLVQAEVGRDRRG